MSSKLAFHLEAFHDAGMLRIRSTCTDCGSSVVSDANTVKNWASEHRCGGNYCQAGVLKNPYYELRTSSIIPELLTAVMDATASDFGNVQLFDSLGRVLRLVAHRGFKSEFLEFFASVGQDQSACAAAMKEKTRVIVRDVATDAIFQNSRAREVMLDAEAWSVQSTPLFARSGTFFGMVSTHYRSVGHPLAHELELVDRVVARYTNQLE